MSYADSLLAKDEHVVYRARQHWLAPLSDSRNGLLLFLAGVVIIGLEHWFIHLSQYIAYLGLLLALVGAGWIGLVYVTWRAQEYIITTRRVLKVEGLLDKKAADSSLDKINDAILSQGLLARILKYGDLEILTANEDALDRYHMLAHAVTFKKSMLDAKNQLEDGYRGSRAADPTSAPGAPNHVASARQMSSDDVTATLSKLADLRDKGAITPAEYEAKKADLLGRI